MNYSITVATLLVDRSSTYRYICITCGTWSAWYSETGSCEFNMKLAASRLCILRCRCAVNTCATLAGSMHAFHHATNERHTLNDIEADCFSNKQDKRVSTHSTEHLES